MNNTINYRLVYLQGGRISKILTGFLRKLSMHAIMACFQSGSKMHLLVSFVLILQIIIKFQSFKVHIMCMTSTSGLSQFLNQWMKNLLLLKIRGGRNFSNACYVCAIPAGLVLPRTMDFSPKRALASSTNALMYFQFF